MVFEYNSRDDHGDIAPCGVGAGFGSCYSGTSSSYCHHCYRCSFICVQISLLRWNWNLNLFDPILSALRSGLLYCHYFKVTLGRTFASDSWLPSDLFTDKQVLLLLHSSLPSKPLELYAFLNHKYRTLHIPLHHGHSASCPDTFAFLAVYPLVYLCLLLYATQFACYCLETEEYTYLGLCFVLSYCVFPLYRGWLFWKICVQSAQRYLQLLQILFYDFRELLLLSWPKTSSKSGRRQFLCWKGRTYSGVFSALISFIFTYLNFILRFTSIILSFAFFKYK